MKGTFSITLIVAPKPLAVDPTDQLGVEGTAIPDGTVLPISGGTPPYQVTNVVGDLPPGVSVNADGTVDGTPTKAGSYPVTIDVQDSTEPPAAAKV